MSIEIRLTKLLYDEMRRDLERPHPFAAERVGFVLGRIGSLAEGAKLILLTNYHSIPDARYVRDRTVGARIGQDAMTAAMQAVYHGRQSREGIFHIHLHPHRGVTGMSGVDRQDLPKMIPGFQSVSKEAAHGIVILSEDHGSGWVWLPGANAPVVASRISVVGPGLRIFAQPEVKRPEARRPPVELPVAVPSPTIWQRIADFFRRAWSQVVRGS